MPQWGLCQSTRKKLPVAKSRGSKGQCGPWLAVASERRGESDDALTRRGVARLSESPTLAKQEVAQRLSFVARRVAFVLPTSIVSLPYVNL